MQESLKKILNKIKSLGWIFTVTVAIPGVLAVLYYGFLASDIYISESSFLVRTAETRTVSGVGSLLGGVANFGANNEDIVAVQDFAVSRDALSLLDVDGRAKSAFTGSDISIFDRFGGFGLKASQEDFFEYYKGHVVVNAGSRGSVIALAVRAYRPEDAHWINERLLSLSESLINRLNERAQADLVGYELQAVEEAEAKAKDAALALSKFRTTHRIVDPELQVPIQLQLIAKLQDELIANQSQLDQLRSTVPENPQVAVFETRVKSLKRQIAEESQRITGDETRSFAGAVPEYQRALLESQFADRQLTAAMTSLQKAQEEASRKKIYVETIIRPAIPDHPLEPHRLRSIAAVLAVGVVLWGVLSMLVAGVLEHGS